MKKIKQLSTLEKASFGLAIGLLLCLLPLPYGFYSIIRLATAIIAGCWAYKFYNSGRKTFAIIACSICILFQPFFKITLDRFTWNVVDVILAVILILFVFQEKK